MNYNDYIWAASGGDSTIDTALKLVSGVAGVIALLFTVYVVFLKRKWKSDEKHAQEMEEKKRLEFEGMITALKTELDPLIKSTAQMMGSVMERVTKVEDAVSKPADNSDLRSLKYNVDNDVAELKRVLKDFEKSCGHRHDKIASFGSIADLKARVDGLSRKISGLEDFRHASADRYVLMANYHQDIKLVTDAISVLRQDLRAMIEMVDKL